MRLRDVLNQIVKNHNFFLSVQEVRKILGVDAGSFQQWLARELIPFETVRTGKRTWRRFHVREIPRLVLISEILSNGLRIGEAINTADTILNWRNKQPEVPWAVLWFRAVDVIYFVIGHERFPKLFQNYDQASCILIIVANLKHKVEHALAAAVGGSESVD